MAEAEAGTSGALIVIDHGVESVIHFHDAGKRRRGSTERLLPRESRGVMLLSDWLASTSSSPVAPQVHPSSVSTYRCYADASCKRASEGICAVFVPHAET